MNINYSKGLLIFSLFLVSCKGLRWKQGLNSQSLKYNGESYELFSSIPMSFDKDTIYPELWHRTLNVDGDNKRIILLFNRNDTTIFYLPNGVNNYTETICCSLKVGKHRYLWLEDNFGTTVLDIDLVKHIAVTSPKKIRDKIASTGAPIGTVKEVTKRYIVSQLNLKIYTNIEFLDSLNFKS